MLPATIATSVAPETISKVGRLFNGSATDVLNELLQNARRAGASHIVVSTSGNPGDRLLHIVDDGHGIADPASIVTLGRSGWSDETRRREDPAGMGVFSLAGRDVIIRSFSRPELQGWMAHIPASAWESSRPIAISPDPITRGTAITVRMPDAWAQTLDQDLAKVAKHYPLPVTLDGAELPRQAWLAEAVHVEDWNGSRIGVFRDYPSHTSIHNPRLNFHGVTIPCRLPSISEVGCGRHWHVRVDIIDTPDIQLVLPARKEAVQNAALEALGVAAQAAIFHAIAAEPSHRLSYSNWCDARDLGIVLPEADPWLRQWVARHADSSTNYDSGTRVTEPGMVIMPDLEPIVAQPAAVSIAAHSPFGGPLVEQEPRFIGYGWYDVLAHVERLDFTVEQNGLAFTVSDEEDAPEGAVNGYADTITLLATIAHAGALVEVSCDAVLAFGPSEGWYDAAEERAIYIRRGSGLTPATVADIFERAAFDPSDDAEADSTDTQREHFGRTVMTRVIDAMEGGDAALENQIRSLLNSHSWVVPEDRTVTVTMTRAGLAVAIADRTPEAA